MKATLLLATMSIGLGMPMVSAKSELETLKARCSEQEKQIATLEARVRQLKGTPQTPTTERAKADRATPPPKEAPPTAAEPTADSYVVKAGDHIEKIARQAGCSVASLEKLNQMKADSILRPGQVLKLPNPPASRPSTTPESPQIAEKSTTSGATHTIQDNETFSSIAKKYGIPVSTLIAANPKVKPTALRTGMIIQLGKSAPPRSADTAKSPETAKTADPKKSSTPNLGDASTQPIAHNPTSAPASPPPTIPSGKKVRTITIDDQITYGQFAANHGTDTDRLNDLNGLDLTHTTVLAKGSELYVPNQP